jgi:fimbrial isopeptide formation D2 family protein/LPXTG-motif cell wall-anchored protein
MKKTFTKLAGGIMAASMILGTAGVAAPQVFAADPAGQVSVQRADLANHEYGIYEIFKADKSGDSLINVEWGDNINADNIDKAELAKALGLTKDGDVYKLGTSTFKLDTAQSVAEAITAAGLANGEATVYGDADKLAKVFADALTGEPKAKKEVTGESADAKATFDGLTTGYYLIKDTKNVSGAANGAMTKYIVTTVVDGEDAGTITSKSDIPTSEKKVKDINDTTGEESGWQDAADYDTGDKIPFRLQATFGSAIDNYKNYYMAFVDNMSKGLTYDNDIKIVLDLDGDEGTPEDQFVLAGDKIVARANDPKASTIKDATNKDFESNEYKWAISDVFTDFVNDKTGAEYEGKTIKELIVANKTSAKVWAYYTATLDKDNCRFGAPGNPNNVKLEYQTNPDWNGEGEPDTDDTPEDRNIVFTIKEVVNKKDENGAALTGAGFTLYKECAVPADATGNTYTLTKTDAKTGTTYTITLTKGSKILADHDDMARGADIQDAGIKADKYYETKTVVPNGAEFTASGLDDGHYVLVETTIPNNYNSAANIEFDIKIEHATTGDTVEALNIGEVKADKHTTSDAKDTISTDVENRKGSVLPSTGGIGTTIFYIVGAAAAVTAIVLLTTRRRANKED